MQRRDRNTMGSLFKDDAARCITPISRSGPRAFRCCGFTLLLIAATGLFVEADAANSRARKQLAGGAAQLHPAAEFSARGSKAAAPSISAAITSPDIDKTADWYERYLGFREIAQRSEVQGRTILLERTRALLEIREDAEAGNRPAVAQPDPSGAISLTVLVDDVDREVEHLQAMGVEIVIGPRDRPGGDYRGALIRDVDGRLVRLREAIDNQGASGRQ